MEGELLEMRKARVGVWLVLFVLAIVLSHLAAWRSGRLTLIHDLQRDGYNLRAEEGLRYGEGRLVIQVWRDGSWTDVGR